MSLLITPSFLSSASFLRNCPPHWGERAYTGLRDQLARDYSTPMPDYVQRGIDFENAVYKYAQLPPKDCPGSDMFKWFVEQARGGEFQRKTKKYINIRGEEYCLYGKLDIWFPDKIIDIKTTDNWKGTGKYLASAQHLLYCWSEEISDFDYHVAVFNAQNKVKYRYVVPYRMHDLAEVEDELRRRVNDAMELLQMYDELDELYRTTFSRY